MGNIINKLFQIISKKTGFDIIGVKKYSANFSYLIGEYIFSLMSSLIVGIAVARYLGPESYGIINFAISVYAICIVITTLGIDDIIYKEGDACSPPKKRYYAVFLQSTKKEKYRDFFG